MKKDVFVARAIVPLDKAGDWIDSAINDGSRYWARLRQIHRPDDQSTWSPLQSLWHGAATFEIEDIETRERHLFKRRDVERGIRRLLAYDPLIFGKLMQSQWDTTHADVFFQYVVLGSILYQ